MGKLLKYLKNYRKESILAPLFKLIEVIFELIVPLVVADIIDIVQHPGRVQPTGWESSEEKPACYHELVSRWYVRTKDEREAVESKLGAVTWLPDQDGWHGGVTGVLPRRALKDSGLELSASWPVLE